MNAERHSPELGSVARKQLFLLEKLHEEWELSGRSVEPLKFGWQRYEQWGAQGGIEDNGQLTNILRGLEKIGLITKAEWINPAR